MQAKGWSVPATSRRVLELVADLTGAGPACWTSARAGLEELGFHGDRTKRSSAFWAVLLAPLLASASGLQRRRMARKRPQGWERNRDLLRQLSSWPLLTSRTAILAARKPPA